MPGNVNETIESKENAVDAHSSQSAKLSRIDTLVNHVGNLTAWLFPVLMIAICTQVILRKMGSNQAWLDDAQWWIYGFAMTVGFVYAITTQSHVRVDILYANFSHAKKSRIDVFGLGWLLLPFLLLMTDILIHYSWTSFLVREGSDSPNGLHHLYLLKMSLPIIFLLGIFAAISLVRQHLKVFAQLHLWTLMIALFPAVWFVAERFAYYSMWWFIRLMNPEIQARRISREPLLEPTVWYGLSIVLVIMAISFFKDSPRTKGRIKTVQILALMGEVMDLNQWLVLSIFICFIYLLFRGIPVAFALVGIGLFYVVLGEFVLDPNRGIINNYIVYDRVGLGYKKLAVNGGRFFGGVIKNPILVALPMFIFMGLMLDQSGVAQRMMRSIQVLFGALRGGLALSVMLIGIVLAASTGVIGASVVLLGVMGIPTMLEQNYKQPIAAGTIAASGTLGILIPPSIMLVIMSDQLAISLGDLFMGALLPGLLLGGLYVVYIIVYGLINPAAMPLPENREPVSLKVVGEVALSVLPPFSLIVVVLGSIFFGIATPTEASGLGAMGATILAFASRRLTLGVLKHVMRQTLNTSGYIVGIFITASFFAFVLRRYGGDEIIENLVLGSFENPYLVVAFILFIIFCLGFLLDWIEITLIIMPLMLPVILSLDLAVQGYGVVSDPSVVWFAVLVAVTLQTSFLTPPVGFALFYLKGVCPPEVTLGHIYRGVIPFVLLQLLGLGIVFAFPALTTWLPAVAYGN